MGILKKLIKPLIILICLGVIIYAFATMHDGRGSIKYIEHLDDVAVTVDGNDLTFEDLAFYILYKECQVEMDALVYNKASTKDYWNMHTNEEFVSTAAKNAVIGMAIHDEIFYQLAKAEGMDKLSAEEEQELEFAKNDFWEDLLDCQWERLPCDEDTINQQIYKVAVAEKYQNYLAKTKGPSQAAYKFDGYYYEEIKAEHQVEINKKLWKRFVMGDNTLYHSGVNFINGFSNE